MRSIQQLHTEYKFYSSYWIQQGSKKSMKTYSYHKKANNPSQETWNVKVWFLYQNPHIIYLCFNYFLTFIYISFTSHPRILREEAFSVSSTTFRTYVLHTKWWIFALGIVLYMFQWMSIHFLGTQGISLRVCGAENPSQGTWEPGALRAALNLGGQQPLEEPCSCPSLPSDRILTAGALGSVQPTSP